jgi:hypothetical protein
MKRFTRETVLNFCFSFGAAIVIFGAWGKIEHHYFADTALTAGLLSECVIFLIYAFTPPKASEVGGAPSQPNDEVVKEIRTTNSILNRIYK